MNEANSRSVITVETTCNNTGKYCDEIIVIFHLMFGVEFQLSLHCGFEER